MKYSVLMSVYKNDDAKYLYRALTSIYDEQTVKPDEIVVVFDGPLTPELYDVLNKFQYKKEDVVFYYIKGLDLLVAAIKKSEVKLRECQAVFEIYGPNDEGAHENLSQMIHKLNIEDLVQVGKERMGMEKQETLLSSTCFIQTSRTEGLPLGPLEALSYGLPCIVTRGVGLGEIIESYGAGYQSENTVEGISKSIERFIRNVDKLEQMSQSAIRLIEENFNIEVLSKKTIDGYYIITK